VPKTSDTGNRQYKQRQAAVRVFSSHVIRFTKNRMGLVLRKLRHCTPTPDGLTCIASFRPLPYFHRQVRPNASASEVGRQQLSMKARVRFRVNRRAISCWRSSSSIRFLRVFMVFPVRVTPRMLSSDPYTAVALIREEVG
jgi:hypothetical protein